MIEIPKSQIKDRSAWVSQDLNRDQSWIYQFTANDISELLAAVEKVKSQNIPLYKFSRDEFTLFHLRAKIERIIDEVENGRGVVLWRGLDINAFDEETLKFIYWGLGVHLGCPISQNSNGDLVGQVRDSGRNYSAKNVRGYTTKSRIAPHCDSSDVVTLLCLHPAKSGGESLIVSSISLFNKIWEIYPNFLPILFEGFYFDLRGEGATGLEDEVTSNKVPIFSFYRGRLSCRYNQKTIMDGQIKAALPLSGDRLAAIKILGELALGNDMKFNMTFQRGDIQILNNHMVLHSREDFEDWPEKNRKRNLLRIWINLDKDVARVLSPDFSDRLNTGPRGGVALKEFYTKSGQK